MKPSENISPSEAAAIYAFLSIKVSDSVPVRVDQYPDAVTAHIGNIDMQNSLSLADWAKHMRPLLDKISSDTLESRSALAVLGQMCIRAEEAAARRTHSNLRKMLTDYRNKYVGL